jgi:hypothetical protein
MIRAFCKEKAKIRCVHSIEQHNHHTEEVLLSYGTAQYTTLEAYPYQPSAMIYFWHANYQSGSCRLAPSYNR